MFNSLKKQFGEVIYAQIWSERIKLGTKNSAGSYDEKPLVAIESRSGSEEIVAAVGNDAANMTSRMIQVRNPFSEESNLVSDVPVAKKLVQHAFNCLFEGRFLPPSPDVIVQFMDRDVRRFPAQDRSELATVFEHAGARAVKLYDGSELDISTVTFKDIPEIPYYGFCE